MELLVTLEAVNLCLQLSGTNSTSIPSFEELLLLKSLQWLCRLSRNCLFILYCKYTWAQETGRVLKVMRTMPSAPFSLPCSSARGGSSATGVEKVCAQSAGWEPAFKVTPSPEELGKDAPVRLSASGLTLPFRSRWAWTVSK